MNDTTTLGRVEADDLAARIAQATDCNCYAQWNALSERWETHTLRPDGTMHRIASHEQARSEGWATSRP